VFLEFSIFLLVNIPTIYTPLGILL